MFWETHEHAGLGPSAPEQQRTIWRGAEGARRSPRWHPRPPSAQRRVLSDPAFALRIPAWLSRCSLVWLGAASPATHPALGRLHTLAAALRTAAARAPRPPAASPAPPGRAALSSAGPSRSAAPPAAPPPPAARAGAVKPAAAEPAPELPRLLSFLCVRASGVGAEGEGGGRSVCLSPAAFARAARSAVGKAGAQGRARGAGGPPGPRGARGSARRRGARPEPRSPRSGRPSPPLRSHLPPTRGEERAKAAGGTETAHK